MNIFYMLVVAVQVLSAIAIIVLVLLQHGKGADMGAAFGSGSSGSLFGASGSANFLSRSTAVAAGIFFVATLCLTFKVSKHSASVGVGVMSNVVAPAKLQAPVQSNTQSEKAAPQSPTNQISK